MQLSAAQFENILATLKSDGGSRLRERRLGPRVGVRCNIHIIPVADGKAKPGIEVALRDIAREGIGISATTALRVGSQFIAQFPKDPAGDEVVLVCTVQNCRQLDQDAHAIGARFVKMIRNAPRQGAPADHSDPPASPQAEQTPAPPAPEARERIKKTVPK